MTRGLHLAGVRIYKYGPQYFILLVLVDLLLAISVNVFLNVFGFHFPRYLSKCLFQTSWIDSYYPLIRAT